MSGSISLQRLRHIVEELLANEGIMGEYDIHIKSGLEKGKNYIGEVTFFNITPKETSKIYHLVMKTISTSDAVRKVMPLECGFKRECYMYSKVFPTMKEFLTPFGDDVRMNYIPKFYSICEEYKNETLILEDLFHEGFLSWDRYKVLDMDHVLLVLKSLAEYHAISLAMSKKIPKDFEGLSRNLSNMLINFGNIEERAFFFKRVIQKVCGLLEKSNRKDLAEKIDMKIVRNVENLLLTETSDEDKVVISHGDCWNSNILFKYTSSTDFKPSEICFVDFQFCMLDTPVKDISFFLYTSCDKSQLDKFDFLLQTYYASFSKTLKSLECEPDKIFSYEDLLRHWKKYSAFGLVLSSFFIRIEQLLSGEVPEMNTQNPFDKIFEHDIKNEDIFRRRIMDVFTHYAETFL
ncbi:hypothetical protein WA026_005409 [Henosepilachna vigintioctopunctata]|uniref:CHK kinase-like domain-containing protein n=1 Tax=Henosepilachna vigintioctopunctata TaxID=420089 RepID=A0AAW1U3R1_9CUCU